MPEDLPVRTCINVMVGITRSKVIGFYWFIDLLVRWVTVIHWVIDSCPRCVIDWFSYFIDLLFHPLILIHWIIGSRLPCVIDSSSDSWIQCFVPSSIHWFIDSLFHWFIQSAVRGFFMILSCHVIGISTTICSLLMHLTTSTFRCFCISTTFL